MYAADLCGRVDFLYRPTVILAIFSSDRISALQLECRWRCVSSENKDMAISFNLILAFVVCRYTFDIAPKSRDTIFICFSLKLAAVNGQYSVSAPLTLLSRTTAVKQQQRGAHN